MNVMINREGQDCGRKSVELVPLNPRELKQNLLGGRRRAVLEAKLIEEETDRRVKQNIEARVQEVMLSDAVQKTLQERLEVERKKLEEEVLSAEVARLPMAST